MLVLVIVYASLSMRDIGFEPDHDVGPIEEVKKIWTSSIDAGFRNPPVRWVMLAAPSPWVQACTPSTQCSRTCSSSMAMTRPSVLPVSQRPSWPAPRSLVACSSQDPIALQDTHQCVVHGSAGRHGSPLPHWCSQQLLGCDRIAGRVGAHVLCDHADPPGVYQRLHSFQTASDGLVVRCAAWIIRGCRFPTCARSVGGCLELRDVVFHHGGDHSGFASILSPGQA